MSDLRKTTECHIRGRRWSFRFAQGDGMSDLRKPTECPIRRGVHIRGRRRSSIGNVGHEKHSVELNPGPSESDWSGRKKLTAYLRTWTNSAWVTWKWWICFIHIAKSRSGFPARRQSGWPYRLVKAETKI